MSAGTYLIGIAGPSGAGKTCLATNLATALQAKVLGLDCYYRDLSQLARAERDRMNFDAPQALEDELLIEQVTQLLQGRAVKLPVYDFAHHIRSQESVLLEPVEVLIIEGLFTLYWPRLRELLGTAVYVDLHDELCLARRTDRDVRERGRTPESVLQQYAATVAPMAQRYVRPTIANADVIVSGTDPIQQGVTRVLSHYARGVALGERHHVIRASRF